MYCGLAGWGWIKYQKMVILRNYMPEILYLLQALFALLPSKRRRGKKVCIYLHHLSMPLPHPCFSCMQRGTAVAPTRPTFCPTGCVGSEDPASAPPPLLPPELCRDIQRTPLQTCFKATCVPPTLLPNKIHWLCTWSVCSPTPSHL